MQFAQTYQPYYQSIWITVLVENILFISFSVLLVYKSCKIKNNRFFLLISLLITIEAFSGEEIFRKLGLSINLWAALPVPINCQKDLVRLEKTGDEILRN